MVSALAGVVFLDLGDPQPQQFVPLVRRQPVERLVGAGQVRRQRKAERAQQLGAVEAGGQHALLNLGDDRLAVDGGGEGEEVDRVLGGTEITWSCSSTLISGIGNATSTVTGWSDLLKKR